MSFAELDSAVEPELRSAIRDGSTIVTDEIFDEAFETFNSGEVKKWDIFQLERGARYEAGHALICMLSEETPSYYTRNELPANIRTSLGGRAAEIVYYGKQDSISTGAAGDLVSATEIAQRIICTYGMDNKFGSAVIPQEAVFSGNTSAEVRAAVNKILNEQMSNAIKSISDNKNKIDALVERLIEKNHLNSKEIEQTIKSAD